MNGIRNALKLVLVFVLLIPGLSLDALQKSMIAKVIGVKDGDTIDILYEGKPITIRFAHVDCPEIKKGQPYGQSAKKYTAALCYGQRVTVIHQGQYDRYKRLIAVVINQQGLNVNKELVKAGMAWHFKKYSSDMSYDQLERIARKNKVGLWQEVNPTPPWAWRKQ